MDEKHVYEIKEVETVEVKKSYIIVEDGKEEPYSKFSSRNAAQLSIDLRKAVVKIAHLPYFNYFYYCPTLEDFTNYANVVGYQHPLFNHFTHERYQDTYFIRNAKSLYHGPDWYKLTITEDDGENYYSIGSFKNIQDEYEKRRKQFENALNTPKTFEETYSSL